MLKIVNIIILMALAIFAGCNNPSGGSSIAPNHTPGLQPPGPFAFTAVQAANGNVNLRWSSSSRASKYDVFMGTTNTDISTPVATCSAITAKVCNLTGLTPTTLYYFNVVSTNAAGTKNINAIAPALSVGAFDITGSSVGDASFTVSWNASAGATSYNVLYGTSSGSYIGSVSNVTSPATITGLSNNVRYYVRVVATNASNGYALSDTEANDMPFGPPSQPTGLTAVATPGSIALDWNNSVGATSYKLFRGTTSGSLTQIASGFTSSTYVDSSISDGTTYYYAVQGFNGFDSVISSEVAVRSISDFNITTFTAGPGASQLTVTWPAVTGASGYDVYYGTNPASLTSTSLNATSPLVLTSLSNALYYVRVRAKNAVGLGTRRDSLNQLSATPVPLLAAPASFTATATPGQVVLNWNAVSGASTYEVLRGTATGVYTSLATGISGTTYTDSSVANGTAYFYTVRGYNGINGTSSAEASVKPIASFTISSATALTNTTLQVTWGAGAGADFYDVQYGTVSGTYSTTVSAVASPYTITGLSANTTYYVVVRGRNAQGTGTSFITAQASAKTKTAAPTGLVATATPGTIDLNWTDTSGATTYNVYRGTSTGSYTLLNGAVATSNYTDSSATNGTAYFYVVTADNGLESANSAEVSAKAIASFTASTISALSPSSIQVTWPATAGGDTFDVRYGTTSGTYTTTLTNRTSPFTITGLTGGTTYYVKIVAKNATGLGTSLNAGNELSQTTPVGPPSGVLATVATDQITISWTAMPGASSYKIYRGTVSGTYTEIASNNVTTSYVDTGTSDGVQYYYVVKSFNGADSADSAEVTGKTITPFSLTSVTAASTTSLVVTFPTTVGADVYDVRYGTATGSYTTTVSGVTSPNTITGLTANTTYYVVARGRNAIGSGASQTTAEMSIKTPVAAPTGLAAASTPNQVILSWTNVTGATSYNVYRGTVSGTTTLIASAITNPYTDLTAVNGTTYYYAVSANNGSESAKSSEVATQPIASHTITSITSPSSTSLQVTWGAVTGATGYDVLYGTTSGTYTGTALTQTSPYTITGLAANTTYYVVVRAKNAVGAGTTRNSTEDSEKTLTSTPVGLTATAYSGQVGLNWTATTGATSYNVYRGTTSGSLTLLGPAASNAYLDTTITNGTTYYYAITANNGSESAQSAEVSVRPIASFTITSATPASSTSATITWPAAAGAATYDVRYGTSPGVYLTTVTGVTSPYTLTGLTANTLYYVAVRANNAVGAGTTLTSAETSFTTATAAPTTLVATSTGAGTASLTWTAATGAASYNIYRGTATGVYTQIATGITGTSYPDTTVTDGTTYYYAVRAYNGAESPNSNEGSVRPIGTFTITSVTAPTATTLQVTWPAATGATAYDVRYGTVSGTYTTITGVTSPYTITGLASGTNYYVVVRARNVIGGLASTQSAEVSQTTPVGPPTLLTSTAISGTATLSWVAAGGASYYKVYRGTVSGTYSLIATNVLTTSYPDPTVVDGTTYYYVVKSFNGADSIDSNETSIRSIAPVTISSVTSPTSTSLQVTWPASAGAATYDVRYGTATGVYGTTVTNQTSPYTISGLTANTTYYVVVRANNTVGNGTTVTSAESSKKTATGAPVGLIASATPGQVGLNWTATAGATTYNVYRGTSSGALTLLSPGVSGTAYMDTTVTNGTTYFYTVSADNGTESAQSSEVSVRPISSFSISALSALSSTSLSVTWGAATGAATYDVRYGTASGVYMTVTGVTSPYTLTGLTANTLYYVVVRANNAIGSGTSYTTSEMNVTTSTAAPTTLVATATTGQIDLSWVAASGATSYHIYRGTTSGSYTQIATGVTGTTFPDTSVINGTQYYYSVRSFNGTESVNSNEATGKSIATFTVGGTTSPTSTTIQVSWTNPAGGDVADVRYGTVSGTYTTVSGVTSPYTITGLTPNTTYYVVVRARNIIGLGSSSQTAEVTQKTATAAPAGLAATATPGSVALTWTATTGATNYNIYRSTTSGSYGAALMTAVGTNSYTDATVANGTTYFYTVTSNNGSESAKSNEATIRPVASFTITSALATSTTTVDVTWPAVAGAAAYDLKYGTTSGTYTTTLTNQTSPVTISGLSPGSTVYVVVVARNAVGPGTSYQSAQVSAQTAFGAPGSLTASATPGSVSLTWLAVAGATSYKLYRGTATGSYTLLDGSVATNSYTDATAANGTTYFYVVTAFNGAIESPNSNEATIRPISTFTLSSATPVSSTGVDLVWTAATGAASYDVRYGTTTGTYTTTLTGQTSPLSVTGLTANTTYYFQVQAKNAVGAGTTVSSTELSAKTATATPSGLVATATTGQIALSWTATTGATNYNIYRSTTAGSYGAALVTANAGTTYTDSTVANGTTYYYVVRANNGIESANSNEVSGQSIAAFSITSVTAPSTTSLVVTWPATSGAATYDVRYGTSTGSYSTTLTNRTSPFTITGLTAATTYYVVVRANNAVGSGSSAQTAEVSQITPLAAPSGLTATSSPSSVALAWTAVGGASSYRVYRSTSPGSYGASIASPATNSYTDSTAANGTTYYYVVTAYNGAESAISNEVSTQPIASFAITSTSSPSSSSITVTWPSPVGGATYDVRYGTATGSYTSTVTGQTSPYTITGLTANTNYYIAIRANNAVGAGTSRTSTESIQKTATGAPTGLAAVASPGSVALTWTATTGASSYKVYRSTTSGSYGAALATPGTNSYTDATVTNGTTYFYTVVSVNGSDSAMSTEVTVLPISTFTFSSAVAGGATSATLTWTAATGAAAYDVQYGLSAGSYVGTLPGVTSPYTNNTLSANTTYYARIVARNAVGAGTTVYSSELSVKTSPTAPAGLTATATTSQVALSWTASTGATAYKIYRGTTSGALTLLASPAGTGTTYTDLTAVNGTTYFYAVTAINPAESALSSEVSAQPIAAFALTSVVAASTTSLTVTWPATTGATAYDVRYGTATGSYTTTVSGQTSPYTITGLTSGSTYYVVVRARNTVGTGANVQTAEVSAVTPLGAPAGLAATASPGSVVLTWSTVTGASSYRVYRGTTSGSLTLLASPAALTYTDNTAANGTTYFYAVSSYNGSESVQSAEVSKQPIANFTISLSGVSSTSLQVSWTNPSGGATYDVRYGTATGSYATTVTGQTSPYTITGLTANTTYYVVVRANNTVGTLTQVTSTESSLKTVTGAPTGLVATATPGSVGLTWGAVTGASTYKIYRGTASGALSLLTTSGTASYTDATAANGTTYFYAIVSNNGADSAQSAEVSVQPISSFSLTAATAASSSSIDLTWGTATGSAAYDVRYGTSTGVYLTTVSNVTSPYTLTGLTAGTRYYISIRARNAVGLGTNYDSNELNAQTAVGAPATLAAVATPGNVALTWPTVSGATNYNVYRSLTTTGPYTQIASAVAVLTYNDATVTNGTSYFYVVRSYNGIESVNSPEASVRPIGNFTLAAAVVNSSTQITLSWGAAAGAATYDVRYGSSSGTYTTTVSGVTSSYAVTGLTASNLYYFTVRANNAVGAGTSNNSNEVSGRTATAAPTTLAATAGTGSVSLTWVAASGATNYNVYRGTATGVYTLLTSAVAATNYTDSTVVNGTTYYYVVRAYNGTESANSNEAVVTPIGSFSISATTATTTTIQVTWGAASGATAYDVKYGTVSGTYTTTLTNQTSPYTITGLTGNTTYYIIVTARNASGGSVNSAQVSQITAIAAPTGLAATGGTGTVSLTWTAVSGATSYKVYRGTVSGSLTLLTSGIGTNSYADNTPSNGTTYYYAVLANNGTDSALSTEVFKQPIATPSISSITGNTNTSILVTWSAPSGAATYDLQYGTVSGTYTTTLPGVTSPYSITGLTAGTTYYVRLVAKNAIGGGTSVNSAQSSGTPNSPPVMSTIGDQTMEADTFLDIPFTLNDSNNVLTCVGAMSASSSNTTLQPNSGLVFSGTMPNCNLRITPAATKTGLSTITVTATDTITPVSQTFDLTVDPCTVDSIEWLTQPPASTAAGAGMATAPRVRLLKADGVTLCMSNVDPVTIDIETDGSVQGDATVNTNNSVVPVNGIATFTGATVQRAGTHTLMASQGSANTDVESNNFTITAAAANKIVFQQQPTSNPASTTFIPNPVVRIADTYGNYVSAANVSITLNLKYSATGLAAPGATGNVITTSGGVATYNNFKVATAGSYIVTATPATTYASINSGTFSVLALTPQTTVSAIELLQGPTITTSTTSTYFNRAGVLTGTNYINGTVTWKFKVVVTNTTTSTGTIRLRLVGGTTNYATLTVPASIPTPTMLTATMTAPPATATFRIQSRTTPMTIHSAKIVATQTNATKSQIYIPLSSFPSTVQSITTTSTATTAVAAPNDKYFPTYSWDPSKFDRVDTADFHFVGTGTVSCGRLWDKTLNSPIGAEICAPAAEGLTTLNIPAASLPIIPTTIEARFRSSSGATATFHKAGLMLNMVGINSVMAIQRIVPQASATASTIYATNRATSYDSSWGTGTVNDYIVCNLGAATTGTGQLLMKDYGLDPVSTTSTNTQTPTSTISASTLNLSTQPSWTELVAGPLATTNLRHHMLNYVHTSGNFTIQHCLYEQHADY
ncbi:MAG: fibronectin type III domain-containing protein [Bdellovibrionota bacterium]